MEREQFKVLVKAMKAVYAQPTFIPDQDAFNVWFALLGDLPYKQAELAVQKHMATEKFPPTIADIREKAEQITSVKETEMSELEAWAIVRKAIGRSNYYAEEEFEKLPEACKMAVGNPSNLKVKEVINQPYAEFEKELKEITDLIKKQSAEIDEQVKAFETAEKEEKRAKIMEAYEKAVGNLAEILPFSKVFDQRYLNKTCKLESAIADVQKKIEQVKTDLETIESVCGKYKLNAIPSGSSWPQMVMIHQKSKSHAKQTAARVPQAL